MQSTRRPFITFLTDFGPDSAAAICRGVMYAIAPDAVINDVSHSVRKYQIRDGAFLLSIALPAMPVGVHVAVVDPGVGTARRPIGIRTGRGDILIGPDNGLLTLAAGTLGGLVEVRALENRDWMLPRTSSTFHGRDIFAPMAAHLAIGGDFSKVGSAIDPATLVTFQIPQPVATDGRLDTAIVYIDSFGNLRLAGATAQFVKAFGGADPGRRFRVEFQRDGGPVVDEAPWARTFGDIPVGAPLLYEDSFGNLAYADNQANVSSRLGVRVDDRVRIRPA